MGLSIFSGPVIKVAHVCYSRNFITLQAQKIKRKDDYRKNPIEKVGAIFSFWI